MYYLPSPRVVVSRPLKVLIVDTVSKTDYISDVTNQKNKRFGKRNPFSVKISGKDVDEIDNNGWKTHGASVTHSLLNGYLLSLSRDVTRRYQTQDINAPDLKNEQTPAVEIIYVNMSPYQQINERLGNKKSTLRDMLSKSEELRFLDGLLTKEKPDVVNLSYNTHETNYVANPRLRAGDTFLDELGKKHNAVIFKTLPNKGLVSKLFGGFSDKNFKKGENLLIVNSAKKFGPRVKNVSDDNRIVYGRERAFYERLNESETLSGEKMRTFWAGGNSFSTPDLAGIMLGIATRALMDQSLEVSKVAVNTILKRLVVDLAGSTKKEGFSQKDYNRLLHTASNLATEIKTKETVDGSRPHLDKNNLNLDNLFK